MEEQTQHRTTTATRLRFVLGEKATDVAVPADVPLIDVLPVILPQFGAEWVEQGADHEGWVLQRVGQPPLDEDRTAAQLNLLDGEAVHLRPRADELAAIDYDDLVDGVGEQVREHPRRWTPERTRWMFLFGAAAAFLLGLLLTPGTGSAGIQALIAGSAALVLLVGGALVARGVADVVTASLLSGAGVCYAALAGWLLMAALNPVATPMMLIAASAAAALVALAAALTSAPGSPPFVGAILFFGMLALTGLIGAVTPVSGAEAAAIGLALSLVVGVYVPATSFRLSGLTLPHLPTEPGELGSDIEPVSHDDVVRRGAATVDYSIALFAGLGAAQAILMPMLVLEGHGWSMVLSLVMSLLMFIRARHPDGTPQRWAVLAAPIVGVVSNIVHIGSEHGDLARIVFVVLPVFLTAAGLLLCAQLLPEKRLRPYWGRMVEITESVAAIAVVPILLQVLGVYMWMRGLAG